MSDTKPHAIIIGAGFTGCATAHDLCLRGFKVTVIERGNITNGTSGRTHGLLHSGARYCVTDPEAAIECIQENQILRHIARPCIEANNGLFVALSEEELHYAQTFLAGAAVCGIAVKQITAKTALVIEPNLNPAILTAFIVPDAVFDPLRLALAFAATACHHGSVFHTFTEAKELILDGRGVVSGVKCLDRHTGQPLEIRGEIVINATGAWAGEITQMAGRTIPIIPTPGVMVAYDQRLSQHVINRLAEPGDGDIIIPQRRMSIIGTTSFITNEIDYIPIDENQIKEMQRLAVDLIPRLAYTKIRGSWVSARPLIATELAGRSLSRTFKCYDHAQIDGLAGLVTITGGKATTCRAMAEVTADAVCAQLGIGTRSNTRSIPLQSYRDYYHFRAEANR